MKGNEKQMKKSFDAAKNKFLNLIAEEGFTMEKESFDDNGGAAVYKNDKMKLRLELRPAEKRFVLFRGEADAAADDMEEYQSYLFDVDAGDGERQAESVAYEFADNIATAKAAPVQNTYTRQKKDRNADESSAPFFINRIPTIMPECREPLLKHKAHYEALLPNFFCEEVVKPAMLEMLRRGDDQKKATAFFELLSNHYVSGDLNVKSIIVQTLLNSITGERDIEYVEGKLSDDLKKAWKLGRKYIGKNVKPEKKSAMERLQQYQASTLNDGTRR